MPDHKFNILVVDDSPILVERICDILSELECITFVGTATNFTDATNSLSTNAYDVVILDINLPGKNGIELLSYVKSIYPPIKIIMLSNQSDSYYRNLCHSLGSDSFIDKSSEFEKIHSTISGYFDQHQVANNLV